MNDDKMEQYAIVIQKRVQARKMKNAKTSDEIECEIANLEEEISALAQLYRYYHATHEFEVSQPSNRSEQDLAQLEKLVTIASVQMVSGEISKEHMLEVVKKAKENMLLIYRNGQIMQYADLLLEPEQKEQEER